jgi:hypothetical protein
MRRFARTAEVCWLTKRRSDTFVAWRWVSLWKQSDKSVASTKELNLGEFPRESTVD